MKLSLIEHSSGDLILDSLLIKHRWERKHRRVFVCNREHSIDSSNGATAESAGNRSLLTHQLVVQSLLVHWYAQILQACWFPTVSAKKS